MDFETVRLWAAMGTIMIGAIGPAIAIGMIGSRSAEAIAIYALVVALIIKFV